MHILGRARRAAIAGVLAVAAVMAFTASASAYTAAPGWAASDYATNFANNGTVGPIGVAFDTFGNLYAVDYVNGDFDRFSPGGGDAATHVVLAGAYPNTGGLAVASNHLVLAGNQNRAGLIDVNPITGAEERTVVTTERYGPLAVDPSSGQLYAVTIGTATPTLRQINGLNTASPSSFNYASSLMPDGNNLAGIVVDDHGNVYGTTQKHVYLVPPKPALPTQIATVAPGGESLQYSPGTAVTKPYLVVNRTVGLITKVDIATGATNDIVTGGTRGDNTAVGPDRCLYATQTDRVIKVSNSDGSCDFLAPFGRAATTLTAAPIVAQILPGLGVQLGHLQAHLTTGSPAKPVPNRHIVFTGSSGVLCQANTDANGVATCGNVVTSVLAVLSLRYTATFAGDSLYKPSSGQGSIAGLGSIKIL